MASTSAPHGAPEFTRSRAFEISARTGFAARGVLYLVVAVLALRLADGVGDGAPDQQGALREIGQQPLGRFLLVVAAVGLAGYALWKFTVAAVGATPEAGHHSPLDRVSAVAGGIAYGAFAVSAVAILSGGSGESGRSEPRNATADVFGWPGGRWLVALAGVVTIGVAVHQVRRGATRRFLEDSKTDRMDRGVRRAFTTLGATGLVARGVAFGLVGGWLVAAAREHDPSEAVGLDGALARLTREPYGTAMLVAVAVGFLMFAAYSLADARYRRI